MTGDERQRPVAVSWTAPLDRRSPITGYTVTSSPGGDKTCADDGWRRPSCTVTGLTNGTPYTFTVKATNAAGTERGVDGLRRGHAALHGLVRRRPAGAAVLRRHHVVGRSRDHDGLLGRASSRPDPCPARPLPPSSIATGSPGGLHEPVHRAVHRCAAGSPFCGEIEWMATQGITTGFPDGSFQPSAPMTRQAMAAFLYRYRGPAGRAAKQPFTDVPRATPSAVRSSGCRPRGSRPGTRTAPSARASTSPARPWPPSSTESSCWNLTPRLPLRRLLLVVAALAVIVGVALPILPPGTHTAAAAESEGGSSATLPDVGPGHRRTNGERGRRPAGRHHGQGNARVPDRRNGARLCRVGVDYQPSKGRGPAADFALGRTELPRRADLVVGRSRGRRQERHPVKADTRRQHRRLSSRIGLGRVAGVRPAAQPDLRSRQPMLARRRAAGLRRHLAPLGCADHLSRWTIRSPGAEVPPTALSATGGSDRVFDAGSPGRSARCHGGSRRGWPAVSSSEAEAERRQAGQRRRRSRLHGSRLQRGCGSARPGRAAGRTASTPPPFHSPCNAVCSRSEAGARTHGPQDAVPGHEARLWMRWRCSWRAERWHRVRHARDHGPQPSLQELLRHVECARGSGGRVSRR